jgi:Flp pilus assembly protein TadG
MRNRFFEQRRIARFPYSSKIKSFEMFDRLLDLVWDNGGAEAIEFAVLTPVLLLLVAAPIQFGLTITNYEVLTDAVGAGARQFSVSRGVSSTPLTTTVSVVQSAAPSLASATLTIALSVNGTTCTTDTTCTTALSSAQGLPSTVTATYPCNLTVMGINFAPNCTLSAVTTMMVE